MSKHWRLGIQQTFDRIEEAHPLSRNDAEDCKHVWPARWRELRAILIHDLDPLGYDEGED